MKRVAFILLIFCLGPAAAWAWFHVGTRPPEVTYRIYPRAEIPGHEFVEQPVTDHVIETLATTNLLSGDFIYGDLRFTVFAGDWRAETAQQMSVVAHTPDVCWVASGLKPVQMGQPDMIEIDFDGEPIAFECRIFEVPGTFQREMTLWSTLVGGRFIEEGFRFSGNIGFEGQHYNPQAGFSRRRGVNFFLRAMRERSASDASKQFVRFSTAVPGDDWELALVHLRMFASDWLEVEVTRRDVETETEAEVMP